MVLAGGDSWGQGHCATKRPPVSSLSAPQHNRVLEEPEPGQLCHALRFGLVMGGQVGGLLVTREPGGAGVMSHLLARPAPGWSWVLEGRLCMCT